MLKHLVKLPSLVIACWWTSKKSKAWGPAVESKMQQEMKQAEPLIRIQSVLKLQE